MPKKKTAKPPPPKIGPQFASFAPVPNPGGKGRKARVCLYDMQKEGLPEVVNPPDDTIRKQSRWALVHFPSRRWVLIKTKTEGLAALDEIRKSNNPYNILPEKKGRTKVSASCAQARASGKGGKTTGEKPVIKPESKPEPVAPAGGDEAASDQGDDPRRRPADEIKVPEGMTFDQAMVHCFPVERLMQNFMRLLHAEEDVFNKDGQWTGTRPAFSVQFQTLKALTEWHQGRPVEKEKPPQEKPRMSHDELIGWIEGNPDAVAYLETVIARAKVKQQQAKEGPTAKPVKV